MSLLTSGGATGIPSDFMLGQPEHRSELANKLVDSPRSSLELWQIAARRINDLFPRLKRVLAQRKIGDSLRHRRGRS